MTIKGVLFDLDDTLYDRRLAFRAWADRFLNAHLNELGPHERAETAGLLVELDDNGYGAKDALFGALKARHPELSYAVDELIDHFYRGFLVDLTLDPGAKSLLDHLREKNIPFDVITNGLSNQRPKLAALGVDQWASCVFVSSEFGCKKPDPKIFYAALAELGFGAAETLFVGDHPKLDIAGAKGVGMLTAWIKRPGVEWPADLADLQPNFTVSSLDDLIPLF